MNRQLHFSWDIIPPLNLSFPLELGTLSNSVP